MIIPFIFVSVYQCWRLRDVETKHRKWVLLWYSNHDHLELSVVVTF